MTLYKVKLSGGYRIGKFAEHYVVAHNLNEAYEQVKKFMDEKDLGFPEDRELDTIEVLGDDDYTSRITMLHLSDKL